MAVLLIVEDESNLRSSMVRGLSKLPDIAIIEASSLEQAVRLIETARPSLIISDLDLPDGSGIEILSEMDRAGLRVPLIFISAYLDRYRALIPPRPDVDLCEKPMRLDALRKLVQERLNRRFERADESPPFTVEEYMQLACMGQHSIRIQIEGRGEIEIRSGEIWSAYDGELRGEAALRRFLGGQFSNVSVETLRESNGDRNIESRPWIGVLLDAAKERDERRPGDDVGSLIDRELERAAVNDFDSWMERGIDATLDKNYREALHAFEVARTIRPNDSTLAANIERLNQLLTVR